MKSIIALIILVAGLASNSSAYSQNDSLNRQKYWNIRKRLVTKFVKPGLGPGESIPASKYTCSVSWLSKPNKVIKKIEWYDATGQLGWYIGVIATEMELLQRSGKTNDAYYKNITEELYFALNAINRLDDVAEIIWGYAPEDCDTRIDKVEPVLWDSINGGWLPKPGSSDKPIRNGFFARTDGNTNLLDYFTDAVSMNGGLVRPWVWKDSNFVDKPGVRKVHGGSFGFYYSDPLEPGFEYRSNGYYPSSEASQDQIFGLLIGLMLVNEFIEEDIKYNDISLKLMSKEIALRLLDQYHGWEFRNPVIPQRSLCNRGGSSFAFWQSVKKIKRYFEKGKKNQIYDQILLWGVIDCHTSYTVNRALFCLVAALANSTPQQDLCKYALTDGFDWGFFYLLRRAIYDPKLPKKPGCDYTVEETKSDLNLCDFNGPHYDAYDPGPKGDYVVDSKNTGKSYYEYTKLEMIAKRPPKWHFNNMFANQCSFDDPTEKGFYVINGEFNGLDYMLLYNIANIVFGIDAMGGNYANTREMYFDGRGKARK